VAFVARRAVRIPEPRANFTRYHGVLAPNYCYGGLVAPAKRDKGISSISNAEISTPAERHFAMT
jgi:hypothetical protein